MKNTDSSKMLAQSCDTMGMGVVKSAVKHSIPGMGCSARLKLGKRTLVRFYHRTLFYQTFYEGQQGDVILGSWCCSRIWRTFKLIMSISHMERKTLLVPCIMCRLFLPLSISCSASVNCTEWKGAPLRDRCGKPPVELRPWNWYRTVSMKTFLTLIDEIL